MFAQRLERFAAPEVLSIPLEDVVLQMKAMGVRAIERFPLPTPPEPKALAAAQGLLTNLGALDKATGAITPLGRAMATLPVGVRSAKMLLLGRKSGVLDHVIAMVAGLSERDPLMFPEGGRAADGEGDAEGEEEGDDDEDVKLLRQKRAAMRMDRYRQWKHPSSDALVRLRVAGAFAFAAGGGGGKDLAAFCRDNMLHHPTAARTLELRKQLCRLLNK